MVLPGLLNSLCGGEKKILAKGKDWSVFFTGALLSKQGVEKHSLDS